MAKTTLIRERLCPQCGKMFSYRTARGVDRKYCSRPCAASASMAAFKARHGHKKCAVEGCDRKLKNTRMGLCSAHEARMRRTGMLEVRPKATKRTDRRGYVMVKRVGHPLSDYSGWCYEHRYAAYEASGGLAPVCFWCGVSAPWETNVIDHLDEDKGNNAPENIVIACNSCNIARGSIIPFVRKLSEERLLTFIETLRLMRASAKGQLRLVA